MVDEDSVDRTKVTFSQAEGIEPLPSPLALGELSKEARSLLWQVVHEALREGSYNYGMRGGYQVTGGWKTILYDKHVEVDFELADEFGASFEYQNNKLKTLIVEGALHKVFDFLTFVMRHRKCPYQFANKIHWVFQKSRAAYKLIDDGPTIVPCATPEEGQAIATAFALTQETGFSGARTHLREAADALNKGDYPGCVRESIHAVESVACRLNKDASKALAPALNTLGKSITLHSGLKQGFLKIYGYTSDQDGIRHALFEGEADVDIVDATFMFGACASFVTYLINKARQSGIAID